MIRKLRSVFAFIGLLLASALNASAQVYEKVFDFTSARLEEFISSPNKGYLPTRLLQSTDGNFYGLTTFGGAGSDGTVFKLTPGGAISTLVQFTDNGDTNKGKSPISLVPSPDGNFYGTTFQGGANGAGTIFRMTPAGVLTTLVEFTGNGSTNKGRLAREIIRGSDGNFYGITTEGGSGNHGTIFKMTPGGVLTTPVQFTDNGASNKGKSPRSIVQGTDGNFYGTTDAGGAGGCGTVFKMTPAGVLSTLVEFTGNGASNKGRQPGPLIQGADGNFYGTTSYGGTGYTGAAFTGNGTIFRITPAGVLTTLVLFSNNGASNKGRAPGSLVQGSDGLFYGSTGLGGANGFGTMFKMTAAGVLTTLVQFTVEDGRGIEFQGSDGRFYGIMGSGGANSAGAIFKMSADGELTTVAEFTGFYTTEIGRLPSGLCLGTNGNLYGTTASGGKGSHGTIFRLTPGGGLKTLVEFTDNGAVNKGSSPRAELVLGNDGNFYGTTAYGGSFGRESGGYGTIFKVTPDGDLTTLVEFTADTAATNKGRLPIGGLTLGSDGNFYGTTYVTGSGNFLVNGHGTVFKVTPAGVLTTLATFTGNGTSNKGARPEARLVQGNDGNFYGTTSNGGANDLGTIFRITPGGVLTTLVQFTGNGASNKGSIPNAGLIQGTDGNFYGVTSGGGSIDAGTIFRMTTAGTLTTLLQFSDNGASNKGRFPQAALVQAADGNLYGTTSGGGANDAGTIFRMTTAGVLTTLREFAVADEGTPTTQMMIADGDLYGTTYAQDGSVYRLVFAGAPTAVVTRATLDGTTAAVVEAQVNPRGSTTTVVLEYGTDGVNFPGANNITIATNLTGMQTRLVGTTMSGLAPGTTYHFRFRASSSAGTTRTPVQSFSTLAEPIAIVTGATAITPTTSQFNGTVNARGFNTAVVFEWGGDGNSFPNVAAAEPATVTGSSPVPVKSSLAGLQAGATYFYRIKATSAAGTVVSGVTSFVTLIAPLATLGSTDAVTASSARVAGAVDARGTTTSAVFEYGTDGVNFPNSVTATPSSVTGSGATAVEATLGSLLQGTTYHFRLRATSAGGVATTPASTFTTLALPTATTQAANGVGQSFATVNALVNPRGLTTSVAFEYGIDAGNLTNTATALPSSISGSNATAVNRSLTGLTLDTVYFFRVRAVSSAGASVGAVQSFRTGQSAISVQTGSSSEIASTTARLTGTVNAQGIPTTVAFEVGTSPDLSDAIAYAGVPQLVSEAAPTPVTVRLTDLNEGTQYFYRVIAANSEGTTAGNILSFISEANVAPSAVPDVFFYAGQVTVDPLENDTDQNNQPPVPSNDGLLLAPTLVVPPNVSRGVASVTSDRRLISYNPQFSVRDDDVLTYRVVDPLGATSDAEVRLIAFSKRAGLYGGKITFGGREGQVAVQVGGGGTITSSFMAWPRMGDGVRESFVLKGVFNQQGRLTRTFNSETGAALSLMLQLDPDQPQILGIFEERVNDVSTTGEIAFTLTLNAGTGGLAESGLRTGFLAPPEDQALTMADGFLRMTIGKDSKRGARFAGRLPDGEPFLASAKALGRSYELTRKLEQGGVFTGLVRAVDSHGMMGNLYWMKRPSSKARFHRGGVEAMLALAGVAYPVVPRGGLPPIGLGTISPNARLRLSGGDLTGTYRDLLLNILPNRVQIIGPDIAQLPVAEGGELKTIGIDKMTIKVDAPQARFTGKFIHPETRKAVTFEGAFRPAFDNEPGQGRGAFRGASAAGAVRIETNN